MPKVQPIETGAGGGRARPRRVVSSLSEINVVPLVDVMLVLLIIFMVTAPMMQRTLDVNLPQARRAEPNSDQGVYVTVPLSYRKDRRVRLGDSAFPVDVLAERVRGRAAVPDRQERVPAVRRRADGAGSDGRDGSSQGRRRREGGHRREVPGTRCE